MNSLSPVKDLEQLVSISSSSTQAGGDKAVDGATVEEEGHEEFDEEDAELNSVSPSFMSSNHFSSPSMSVSSGTSLGAPPQASSACARSLSVPRSVSMTDKEYASCGLILCHILSK